eukprot:CAMPEP_0178953048 /NCGR_PEP_ID=MMETSP0789-20121207/8197_1 /TAXON_ID=3005 /ORGANISM="Rhizosolenia setigera, Strain CCMP 1694" /LENGTH=435 /DNA_ID=CAMNT_0020634253 /DNA_START=228 /DNA_END=1535 /DNA_ORIENTATION=-
MSYPSSSSSWDSSSQSADTPNSPSISNTDPAIPVSSLAPTPVTSTDTPTFAKLNVRATLSPTSKPFIQNSSSSFSSSSPTSTPTFTKVVVRDNDPLPSTSVRTCTNQTLEDDISSSGSPSQTQTIDLVFRYTAEVTASDNDDEFLTAVESKLLDTVSSAVLKCDSTRRGRMLFHPIIRRHLQVTQVSSMPPDQIVDSCYPVVAVENTCHIIEARMTITTTSDQDAQQVKLEAQEAISAEFAFGVFSGVSEDGVNPVSTDYLGPVNTSNGDEGELTIPISSLGGPTKAETTEPESKNTLYAFVGLTPLVAALIGTTIYKGRRERKREISKKYFEDVESFEEETEYSDVDPSEKDSRLWCENENENEIEPQIVNVHSNRNIDQMLAHHIEMMGTVDKMESEMLSKNFLMPEDQSSNISKTTDQILSEVSTHLTDYEK